MNEVKEIKPTALLQDALDALFEEMPASFKCKKSGQLMQHLEHETLPYLNQIRENNDALKKLFATRLEQLTQLKSQLKKAAYEEKSEPVQAMKLRFP